MWKHSGKQRFSSSSNPTNTTGSLSELKDLSIPFKGCLKNFSISGQKPSSTAILKQCGLSSCIDETENETEITENDENQNENEIQPSLA
jgi:hypothetical protein